MICPDDHHHECDNRGYRYGGCQGRPSGELVAHRDPRFGKNVTVENRERRNVVSSRRSSVSNFWVERRERVT
jgi:hypothetical protein